MGSCRIGFPFEFEHESPLESMEVDGKGHASSRVRSKQSGSILLALKPLRLFVNVDEFGQRLGYQVAAPGTWVLPVATVDRPTRFHLRRGASRVLP